MEPNPQQPQVIGPDNQPSAKQQTTEAPTPALQPAQQSTQAVVEHYQKAKKPKGLLILLFGLLILALGAAGGLAYLYYGTDQKLQDKTTELNETVAAYDAQIAMLKKEESFVNTYNNADLSRQLCSAQAVAMYDVYINDTYAVFKYLCANQSYAVPVRVAAMLTRDNGTSYEFTYGASTVSPLALPDYIYNSDPDTFSAMGYSVF